MKKILSVCLLLALLFGLVGCNNEPPLTSVFDKEDYTVSLEDLKSSYATEVANLGDQKVDLELLQVAYWTEFVNFLYQNSDNPASNLDPSVPLHEQIVPGTSHTWQQHFLDKALTTLHEFMAMAHGAKQDGLTIPDEVQAAVNSEFAEMEKAAKDAGYTDMNAYVTYLFGPGCTVKGWKAYNYLSRCSEYYMSYRVSKLNVTDKMIEEYYDKYETDFINSGMIKDDTFVYEVRHIMVIVDEGSDETVWEAARVKAQGWLDTYLAGKQTEEAFSQLAFEYSDDNESYMGGGLISGLVERSTYPEAFKNWYLDENRKIGDVELVKTELGYHVMYYVGTLPSWKYNAGQSLTNTMIAKIIPDTTAKYAITVHYDKLMVAEAEEEK